jgi:uncharacterized cupin superfamily protein
MTTLLTLQPKHSASAFGIDRDSIDGADGALPTDAPSRVVFASAPSLARADLVKIDLLHDTRVASQKKENRRESGMMETAANESEIHESAPSDAPPDDIASAINEEGIFEPFDIARVPWEESSHGERFGMRYQHLSSFGGGTQLSISMEILEPGRQANPSHYHLLEEEHVFVLDGSLTLMLGEKRHVMTAGHYICFPAGQAVGHAIRNESSEPCRYLIMGNPHKHDVAVFPETGRVSVKLTGEGYDRTQKMGYWDAVDDEGDG